MNWLRARVTCRSPVAFALAISFIIVALYNWRFWNEAIATVPLTSVNNVLFVVSLFLIVLFIHAAVLLVVPGKKTLRIVAVFFFFMAAAAAYFIDTYGVIFGRDMIRNLLETDTQEATALVTVRFALYVFALGALPAFLIFLIRLPTVGIKQEMLQRLTFVLGGLAVVILLMFTFSAHYASFLREHKAVRSRLNPGYALFEAAKYFHSTRSNAEASYITDASAAMRSRSGAGGVKPLLVFLNIGETARGRNFQLGEYARATNPELSRLDSVYYFTNTFSCGTSTAISVPCLFSHQGRRIFDVSTAKHKSNLLDALSAAGVAVEWRDNNSGSKGVAIRIKTINYAAHSDSVLCKYGKCFDEIMLSGLSEAMRNIKQNTVIVFHQIGSHGPTYWQRYPERFEVFTPACHTGELAACSRESIVNAYDNSIVYTDHVLAEQIRLLKAVSEQIDSLLIYVSDHGESLGEKGLYLHGAPYAIAPDEQTRVPLILWMSDGYRKRFSIDDDCLRAQRSKNLSHDNIYHTVTGALALTNDVYNEGLDILAPCISQHRSM